jgi:exodeoxyribonuclease V alpha subunit
MTLWQRTAQRGDHDALIKAAISNAFKAIEYDGHTNASLDTISDHARSASGAKREDVERIVDDMILRGDIATFTVHGTKRVALKKHADEEQAIARQIKARISKTQTVPDRRAIAAAFKANGFTASDETQNLAVEIAIKNRFSVISGGPGTGKSSLIKIIAQIIEISEPGVKPLCVSLAARIARAIHEKTGLPAETIHQALEFRDGEFQRNAENPINENLIFIEEAFMIGNSLFKSLLSAIPSSARIVVIGDPQQIQPIGRGKPAESLLNLTMIPIQRLSTNHRSGKGSTIPLSGERVMKGRTPLQGDDLDHHRTIGPGETIRKAVEAYRHAITKFGGENVQILAARHEGPCGTRAINNAITGKTGYSTGDRVIQLKNDRDLDFFNGELGTVAEISKTAITVVTDAGVAVEFNSIDPPTLSKAYCITYHKSQGLEFSESIIIVDPASRSMLDRNMVNVGITRAKTHATIIDEKNHLAKALTRSNSMTRRTLLPYFLNKEFNIHK